MGCNCRGKNAYSPTINRTTTSPIDGLCQKINRDQLNITIKVIASGGLVLPTTTLPAHSSISANRCTGIYAERILNAEMKLSSAFNNILWKTEFLQRLGENPTLGSIEALIKVMG